ncbi:malonate transporter subunit MadM [Pseudomonas syringae pv. actinidiae ICMP 19096]|uniref:Malonate transporter subunit MadM n=1 Tax=Pseudomonas syringae pv. actinidiae ICMP 19096 TaxID=1194405 RepID=A0A656JQN7_PSESF|nr:malonate transporter subunit MadM [Pseudomonas syringae pv. actinidiae ICMP 19096]
MWDLIEKGLEHNGLITAFAFVGIIMWVSVVLSKRLTFGRVHGSAIAIVIGLILAWVGGTLTGGQKGLADITLFSGIGLMGGAMLRDFAIVATAFEVQATEARKAGLIGVIALLLGTILPFIVGASIAWMFGYRDAISMTTIGAGAVTYIVGPVTGAALGATSDVMALSIATGLIKAILVMVGTPMAARWMGLDNPRSAMVFGGPPLFIPGWAACWGLRCCISSCALSWGRRCRSGRLLQQAICIHPALGQQRQQVGIALFGFEKDHANVLLHPVAALQRNQAHAVFIDRCDAPWQQRIADAGADHAQQGEDVVHLHRHLGFEPGLLKNPYAVAMGRKALGEGDKRRLAQVAQVHFSVLGKG